MKKKPYAVEGKKRVASPSSMRLALENRLLFDGAVVATAAQAMDDKAAQDQPQVQDQDTSSDPNVDSAPDFTTHADNHSALGGLSNDMVNRDLQHLATTLPASAGDRDATTLLVIDSRANGIQEILKNPPLHTDVRVIDASRDGYEQIKEILHDRGDTSQLHIQSAELDGKQCLGSSRLLGNLNTSDTETLIDWGDDISANTSINFHGGQAFDGKSWLNQVQTLTGGQVRWSDKDVVDSKQAISTGGSQDSKTTTDAEKEKTALGASTAEIKEVKSLVFIDTSVKDYHALLKDIDPNSTVILLDPTKDGVQQMVNVVSKYDSIDAIHIISHGGTGQLKLGSAVLNQASIQDMYADELTSMSGHLSANADILIYGCNFGQGDIGIQVSNQLAALTGADIADSTNDTGAAVLGGDWILENQIGMIEALTINAPEWDGLLTTTTTLDWQLVGNHTLGATGTTYTFGGLTNAVTIKTTGTGSIVNDYTANYTGGTNDPTLAFSASTTSTTSGQTTEINFNSSAFPLGVLNTQFDLRNIDAKTGSGAWDDRVILQAFDINGVQLSGTNITATPRQTTGQTYSISTLTNSVQLDGNTSSSTNFNLPSDSVNISITSTSGTAIGKVTILYVSGTSGTSTGVVGLSDIGITYDKAPLANADTGAVAEDATLPKTAANGVIQGTTGGSVADSDPDDATNTLVVSGVKAGTGTVTQGVGVGSSILGTYGHLTLTSDGSYSYIADNANSLAAGATATDTFTYTVKDPTGVVSNTTTLTITLTGTNDPPTLTGDLSATVLEGGTYVLTAADLGFTDPDNVAAAETFTVSALANGTVLVNGVAATSFTGTQLAAGQVSFQHNGSETTSASFLVNVEDGNQDGSVPANSTFNFSVTPVNDPPALTGDLSATVLEGGTYVLTAADLGFTDPDNVAAAETFTVSALANGTVLVNGVAATSFTGTQLAAGQVSFQHNGSETTSASFLVNVEDGNQDGSVPANSTFNFSVTPVNDPPALTGDLSATVLEGGTYVLTAADLGFTDPDNVAAAETFTVSALANGTVLVNGVAATSFTGTQLAAGQVSFQHNGSETTSASFLVNVEDGNQDGSVPVNSTFNFSVTPVNDPPALTGDLSATVLEGGTYVLTAADLGFTDPDNVAAAETFTVSALANGTVLVNGVAATSFTGTQLAAGQVSFQHNGSETTSASFLVNVEDGNQDGSVPANSTFNFSVTPVNDPPALTGDLSATVLEGGTYVLTAADLGFTDPDNVAAAETFTVSALANGTVLVNGVAATSFTGTQLAAGQVSFQHNGSETTSASFLVNVEDGNQDGSVPANSTFNFSVTPVNDPPALTGDLSATVLEGGTYVLTAADLGFTDPDNVAAAETFTVSALANGTVLVNGVAATSFTGTQLAAGQVSFQHNGSETTSASFLVNVEDGNQDGSVPANSTFNFSVTPVNDPPALTGDLSATVLEGGTYVLTAADLGFTDPDNVAAAETFTVSALANGTVLVNGVAATSFTGTQLAAGQVSFQHNGSETTSASFLVNVEDGNQDGSVPANSTFNFSVTPVNDPPALTGDLSATVLEGGTYVLTAADLGFTDPDNVAAAETFTVSALANGTVLVNGVAATSFTGTQLAAGQVSFQHNGSETTSASFLVNVEDGNQDGSVPVNSTFNFSVTPVNDPPVAVDDGTILMPLPIVEDTLTSLDLMGNDTDPDIGDTLSVQSINGISLIPGTAQTISVPNGTVKVSNTGVINFTPTSNYNGLVTFDYIVKDSSGLTDTGTVHLNVTSVNDVVTYGNLNDNSANVPNTDAQVYEKDLPSGSTPSGTGEQVNGSFTLGPIASLTSFTLGGATTTAITAAQLLASGTSPITRIGAFGTLVINGYNPATSVVNYSYTLTTRANHTVAIKNEVYGISTIDVEGDINNSNSLRINIVDDLPIAVADVDEVINFAGSPGSTSSGNVVTGIGGTDPNNADGNADKVGADTNVSPVTGVVAGTGTVTTGVGVGGAVVSVNGYGSLTLNNNGSYTYLPNYSNSVVAALGPGQTVNDTYTYQITDGDGDTANTTLTITIVGVPAVVGLNDGNVVGTDGSVLESDLAAGTNAAGNGEVLNGSFQLVSPTNGVTSLTIAGITITQAELLALATTNKVITTTNGMLTLNSYSYDTPNGTGTVGYQYTLIAPPTSAVAVTDNFSVSLQDGVAVSTPLKTLAIAIIDDAPIASPDNASVTEDGANPIVGNVFGNDKIGADGVSASPIGPVTSITNSMSVSGTVNGTTPLIGLYGSLTIGTDGAYTYTIDNVNAAVNSLKPGQTLTETYNYQITDNDGDVSISSLTITINGVNDIPVATPGSTATPTEDGPPVAVPLAGTDVDGTTAAVTITAGPSPAQGTLTYDNDGNPATAPVAVPLNAPLTPAQAATVTFTPTPNYFGPVDPVSFTVTDNSGAVSAPADVTIPAIANINDIPVATPGSTATPTEDGPPVAVPLAGTDVDGTTAAVTITAGPSPAQGTLTYDNDGNPATAPVAVPLNAPLTPAQAATVTFTPTPNYFGPVDPVSFTVTDNSGAVSAPADVTIPAIANINDIPVATPGSTATPTEDGPPVAVPLAGTDVDGTTAAVTITAGPSPAQGTLTYDNDGNPATAPVAVPLNAPLTPAQAATVTFTPTPNYFGPVDPVSFTVTDNSGAVSAPADVTIPAIANIDDIPVATPGSTATPTEDGPPVAVPLAGTDVDGTTAAVTITAGPSPAQGTLTYDNDGNPATAPVAVPLNAPLTPAQAATVTFTPTPNYFGPVDPVSFTVTDNSGAVSAPADVTIPAIANINDIPVATPGSTATPTEDGPPVAVPLAGTDVDGTTAAVTITAGPSPAQGTLTYDNDGNPATAPVAVPLNAPLTPAQAATVTFTPTPNYFGPVDPVSFTVTDNSGAVSAPADVTIPAIANINDTPVAKNDGPITVKPNTLVTGNVVIGTGGGHADIDIDGDRLTVTQYLIDTNGDGIPETIAVPPNGNGTAVLANAAGQPIGTLTIYSTGVFNFTPDRAYDGPIPSATYTISDGKTTDTAVLSFATLPNTPPIAVDDGLIPTSPNTLAIGNVLGNDEDANGDNLTVTEFTILGVGTFIAGATAKIPGVGTLVINRNGSFSFKPNVGYTGSIPNVVYTVSDGTATDTAVLRFSPVPDNSRDNIGALIMLANPTPPLFPADSGGYYSLSQFREFDPTWSSDEAYGPSYLSLYGNLQECDLYLTAAMRNQVVLEQQDYSFSVPPNTFCHCNPNEDLQYKATQMDGSPLPSWLHFDDKQLKFTGVPPKGAMNTEVLITAKDRYGNEAYANFKITVNKDNADNGSSHKLKIRSDRHVHANFVSGQHIASAGRPGFGEQLGNSGKMGRLLESRALLDLLQNL